ncbi:hypothetical protein [Bacillus sp. PS06]|uniref:hypothetical protein n=1 Tax=Bacillus sp. PS06 TaxID=2764176 RepID=UPI00178045D0|nr:hypothetical protein [Bacillus sp. PS06]MBD8067798.1 hypothetical protein [Bacillus sp. PS06]
MEKTVFVGVSAGAVILSPNIEVVNHFTPEMNKVEMDNLTALEITEKAGQFNVASGLLWSESVKEYT